MTANGPHLDDELSALLDGELDPAEVEAAQAHLRECAFCTSELAAIDRTRTMVRSLPMVDPPFALHPRREQRRRPVGALAAAAAAVFLLGLQTIPVEGSVVPALADFVDFHAASAAAVDSVPVGANVTLASKYTVVTAPGRPVVDRQTIAVEVLDKRSGKVMEKAEVDKERLTVLWREVYEEDGSVVPNEGFAPGSAPIPVNPRSVGRRVPMPERLDGEYERIGVYRHGGDVVHLLFSDGLHALSVFVEVGYLDDDHVPENFSNARQVRLGNQKAWHWDWPGGEGFVWDANGVVYTAVGDGHVDDVTAAAASMPEPPRPSTGERLKRGCRALADALAGP